MIVPSRPPPLLPTILSKAIPLSPRLDDNAEPGPVKRKTATKPLSASSGGVTSEKKMPKWLKLGSKYKNLILVALS